jgi:hypothetical protein
MTIQIVDLIIIRNYVLKSAQGNVFHSTLCILVQEQVQYIHICYIAACPIAHCSSLTQRSMKHFEYEDTFSFQKFRVPHTVITTVFSLN